MRVGAPWFVAADVCRILDLYMSGGKPIVSNIGSNLRPTETRKEKVFLSQRAGAREMLLLSESAVYKFIMRSSKPEALRFQDWIAAEVLPSIRKTGMYLTEAAAKQAVEAPEDFLARAVLVAAERLMPQERLERPRSDFRAAPLAASVHATPRRLGTSRRPGEARINQRR